MTWAGPCAFILLAVILFIAVGRADTELEFLSEPISQLVKISDGRAVFRCSASPPSAVIRWLFNGQPVRYKWIKVSGHKLTVHFGRMDKGLNVAHYLENGVFQCEIRSKGRVLVSSPAKLILGVLDDFPSQPDVHIAAIPGNTALIPCDPPYSVPSVVTEFLFNGTLINRNTGNYRLMESGDLQIFDVKPEDSGEYICIANNPFLTQKVTSKKKVILHVEEPQESQPPSFIKSPRSKLSVALGSNITLECVVSGLPVPTITWRRHHGKLHHTRYHQIAGNLHIISVRRADEGIYYCEAENSVGDPISSETVVEVQETPQIVRYPKNSAVEVGDNVTLHCATRGHPKPALQWIHNGREVQSDNENKNKSSHLTLRNVHYKDSGIYQCFASNNLGTVYASAEITIIPGNKTHITDHDTDADDDYDIDDDNTSFHGKDKSNSGHSRNGHNNKAGSKKDSSHDFDPDTLGKRPHKKKHSKGVKLVPPSRPEVTRLSNTSAMVRWGVPRNDGLPILFFKVQYKEMGRRGTDWMTIDEDIAAHIHSYAVTNLRTGGKYRFRIAAVYSNNDNKSGPISAAFLLLKDPPMEKPAVTPVITYAEAASPSAITLHWEYEDVDSIPVDGFFIHYRATHTAGKYLKVTVLGANTRSHIISHLLPDTGYDIKMQCFNSAGTSDFSNIYTSKTKASENVTGTRNRNKSHPDEMVSMNTEPVSSKNSDNNMLHIVLGAVCGIVVIAMIVCLLLFIHQRQNRNPNCDNASEREDPLKLGNGHITSNGYIPVNKINISVNPLSHLDIDDTEKSEDLENIVSNNNEIIRLQTFSVNDEPHADPLLNESDVNESTFHEDGRTETVILPCDSGADSVVPEDT